MCWSVVVCKCNLLAHYFAPPPFFFFFLSFFLLLLPLLFPSSSIVDDDGMTALHFAAWYGHPACCQALINANANINAFDHDGATAAHAAAHNGQLATLMVLVETGKCDLLRTDNESQTPKDTGIKQKQVDVVEYLKVMEEDCRRNTDLERLTALHNEATERVKEYKPDVTRAVKDAKKKVAMLEKEAKKLRKETLKLKKERKKGGGGSGSSSIAGGDGPTSFSRMAMGNVSSRSDSPATVAVLAGLGTAQAPSNLGGNSPKPEPRGAARPLPAVPTVAPDVAADMVLAQFDDEESGGLAAFLASLDMGDFARLFSKANMDLEQLQACDQAELARLGIPSGARRKIWKALHPT